MEDSQKPGSVVAPAEGGSPDASADASFSASTSPTVAAANLPFGAHLEPVLHQMCHGRLGPITWFRTDWQRSGALTGYAEFKDDADTPQPVVVKLPIGYNEHRWLNELQKVDSLVPRVYAQGLELDGYDIAWVVMERLPHGPLSTAWNGSEFDLVVEAAGLFYAASQTVALPAREPEKDWEQILEKSRRHVYQHALPHEQRWKQALKKAHRKIKGWLSCWNDRSIDGWCHGDLHLGNAMTRHPAPQGPAVLLDFARTHPGNWVEDAIYFEHLYWARRARMGGRKLCSLIAKERKKHGLPVEQNWPQLASVKRALLAMSTPVILDHDGDPHHVAAALHVLETEVN